MTFFNEKQVEHLLPMHECIAAMRALFSLNLAEDTYNPLRNIHFLPNSTGMLGLMPAVIKPYGVLGIKVLTVFLDNYKKGLSSHQGIVNLFETETGQLLASFDADSITAIRTAAVSALMTDLLAVENAETLCLIGSGKQAEKHLEAILLVRPIKNVHVWSPNYDNVSTFVEKMVAQGAISKNVKIKAFHTAQEAVHEADIICTVTSASTPVIFNDWLKERVHINAVGASTKNKRELDPEIILNSDVYVDNYESAMNEAGDILLAAHAEKPVSQIIKADIHQVLRDKSLIDGHKKTVFKSLGIAIEDVASAWHCWNKSKHPLSI
jgi:ornithine cyclodeaminase/alanine dehydrogenase-like protein (mu-crystallin family)